LAIFFSFQIPDHAAPQKDHDLSFLESIREGVDRQVKTGLELIQDRGNKLNAKVARVGVCSMIVRRSITAWRRPKDS
jgi:hypothetical protein